MAMASANGEKLQFSVGGEAIQQQQWFPDERDGFIMWLRGEFTAANAMIDSLCHHLTLVGEPGEYDGVVSSIQDRRCNWNPVLHMQQFFSISEVMNALQQVAWRRQQRGTGKDFRRNGCGFRQGNRSEFVKGNGENKGEKIVEDGVVTSDDQGVVVEEKRDMVENLQEGRCKVISGSPHSLEPGAKIVSDFEEQLDMVENLQEGRCMVISGSPHSLEPGAKIVSDFEEHSKLPLENDSSSIQNVPMTQNGKISPKFFVANEILDGKAVNVVDGLKLYEKLSDISEVNKIIPLVNDMRAAGKRGELQGHSFVWSKRPMKGHGREMIQLGLADALSEGEHATGGSKDQKMLPIPQLLQDVIDRLVCTQVLTVKPDSCIIDVFNEGDHSQPQMWPSWYGRPVSVLFLTDCEMTFGKSIAAEYPGDYKGSLSISLQPGSMLVMQGNSANLAKYAMSSFQKQRILITLTKLQPRKPAASDFHRLPSPAVAPVPHWSPPPSRSLNHVPNHVRHLMPKHYGPIITNGVLPAQPVRPQMGPPNGLHPIFMPPPVATAMPFRVPVALPPRLPLPGTGVFLPPGSNNSNETSFSAESNMENGLANTNESKLSNKISHKECNGSLNGATGGGTIGRKEDQQQGVEPQAGNQATRED